MNPSKLEVLTSLRTDSVDAKALEGLFAVISEDVLDALESGDDSYLADARRELQRTYTVLAAREPAAEDSPAFTLGRVSGLLDLVGASAARQEPPDLRSEVANPKNHKILHALLAGEKTSKELAERLGIGKAAVSRRLKKLEEVGLVIRQGRGRQTFSRLSVAAMRALGEMRKDC